MQLRENSISDFFFIFPRKEFFLVFFFEKMLIDIVEPKLGGPIFRQITSNMIEKFCFWAPLFLATNKNTSHSQKPSLPIKATMDV